MKHIKTIGIDLAKNIFQLHGADEKGKKVYTKRVTRKKLLETLVNIPACLIAMEACGGAHYWAREIKKQGHEVKIIAPQFVKPYIKSGKNDYNDAEGIAEAVTRPTMKFVPIKSIEQQDLQALHRARELVMQQRIAVSNQLRGLLMEYGITLPQGVCHIKQVPTLLETHAEQLTAMAIELFNRLYEQIKGFFKEEAYYDKKLQGIVSTDERCQGLMKIEGVGILTATAMVASVGDGKEFKQGREMSAWLGLVPKQHSSGDKIRLGGIGKKGNRYLRTLLIHGARSVVNNCHKKFDKRSQWILKKKEQGGTNKAAVALANKNARIMWAMLTRNEAYRVSHPREQATVGAA